MEMRGVLVVPTPEEVWERCSARLRAELGEDVFNSWFGGLKLESIEEGRVMFSVATRFLKNWIDSHYQERILTALHAETGAVYTMQVSVRNADGGVHSGDRKVRGSLCKSKPSGAQGRNGNDQSRSGRDATRKTPAGSPLDKRYTFQSFLIGHANQLAFAAARRVSESQPGEPPACSPLYIYGAVGLGKTHLLQSIAHAATAQGRSVVYLTAERFMHGFVAALQSQTALAFKEALGAIDLLIFDDAQSLQGRVIQTEFGNLLKALIDSRRQVVIAADRPPGELEGVEEESVRSRLAGGLCVEMLTLDEPLRIKILEARIAAARLQNQDFEVSQEVLTFVAHSIVTNGRDLDGAVNRLVAHASVGGSPLTVDAAEVAIRDLMRAREAKRVKIEDIQRIVATHYSVTRADMLSSRRTAVALKPRQVAMYLANALTSRSLSEIGRRFGGRHHTTVLHAVRKIENLRAANTALRDELELLNRMLQE